MVATKSCHNCRRSRLRCDRSIPGCLKCTSAGRECLGYGKFFKWVDKIPSQDQTKAPIIRSRSRTPIYFKSQSDVKVDVELSPSFGNAKSFSLSFDIPLSDPLLQDLDGSSRYYLNYYAVRFCQDLIIYDSPQRGANPFRDLIPMSQTYPFLRDIIIAASALHYSNAVRRWSLQLNESPRAAVDAFVDALRARQKAITSVQDVVERQKWLGGAVSSNGERDALLAAVLFFLNFALIDSGKGGWRSHMNFVGRLLSTRTLESLQGRSSSPPYLPLGNKIDESPSELSTFESIVSLPFICPFTSSQSASIRDYVVSDSTAYYIWSSALDSLLSPSTWSPSSSTFDGDDTQILHILLRTEANSYHSCPSRLLYIVFRTSRLARHIKSNESAMLTDQQLASCLELLEEIQAFDGDAWATEVCAKIFAAVGHIDDIELEYRKHIAATFRASVHLYVLLVAPGLSSQVPVGFKGGDLPNTADLATTIFHHLTFIPTDSPLFKFATWPIFLTGVEAADTSRRTWVLDRLRDMRDLCPWGMLTSTMETLVEIWQMRDNTSAARDNTIGQGALTRELTTSHNASNNNWLLQLQGFKIDCLIV
ncbi:fungal-specific transcription factor domain-containing protein [Hypoxylon rubiginosum]|uniref:Fungal-specific transcription factor domain-containing protein n=1 Tax=Hypoxylon rubiginosum TaxID=110542 RepID=A0ACC0CP43_9PEZI|nr:fungal-specific transcription factor domain-containing protein [Hypoxylon rubiginosum]